MGWGRVCEGFLVVLAATLCTVTAADTHNPATSFPVEGRLFFPDHTVPHATRVTLNGGEFETLSLVDGSFVFHHVPPGIYLLDVLSGAALFSQVKINLPSDPDGKIKCLEYRFPGAQKQPMSYPLDLQAHAKLKYFEEREKIGIHTFLRNPMSYMVLFGLFVIVVFPKMIGNMDPEQLKEMQEMQSQMAGAQDPMEMLKNMWNPPEAQSQPRPAVTSGSSGGGGRGKKQKSS